MENILAPDDLPNSRYRCEYLVIGSGAGGSVASALLAESGRDVIILEDGGYFPPEAQTSNISHMMAMLYRNNGIFPFLGTPTIPFAEGRCVGGGTTVNGALIWRTPPWILEEWHTRHGLKGYSYEDLKPHFETIERDLHVVRQELEDDANLDSLHMLRGAAQLGWRYYLVPRAVVNCDNTNLCPVGCPPSRKQSTLVTYLPRALKNNARLIPGCRAVRIIHKNGVAKKVIAVPSRRSRHRYIEIEFDYLVIACGAIQTPHLLRRSRISRKAGRNLQFHMNLKTVGLFQDELHAERGTIFTVQVQEFEREGLLSMASTLRPHFLVTTIAHHGNAVVDHVLKHYVHSGIFVSQVRAQSKAHIVSALGDQPLVWYRFFQKDMLKIKFAVLQTAKLLFASGAVELYTPLSGSGAIKSLDDLERKLEGLQPSRLEIISVHAMASCPMGVSPDSSIVNPDGRLWDTKNILLADASVLPSNIGESPQGTIMAFAREIITRHLAG